MIINNMYNHPCTQDEVASIKYMKQPSNFSRVSNKYHYRHPYLPQFFEDCAHRLCLNMDHRLLDIACGTGAVAKGFSTLVGEIVAIDKDQAMINVALDECKEMDNIQFLCSPFENIDNIGKFDIATIGLAVHWLERGRTLNLLKRILKSKSHVVICGSAFANERSGWLRAYRETRMRWKNSHNRTSVDGISFFEGSGFTYQTGIRHIASQQLTVEDLVNHSLSFSSSYDQISAAREDYCRELKYALGPFLRDGYIQAEFVTWGNIFKYS